MGLRRGQPLQGGQGLLRPALLYDAEHRVQYHDRQDGGGVYPFTEKGGNDRSHDQEDDHKAVQLIPQDRQEAGLCGLFQLIGTVTL